MGAFFAGVTGWLGAHFLALAAAAMGLALAVPAVVLLYFLKLKRRDQVISSTLLWRRALEDLRVNAPFQKLKTSLLLMLQLLILLALAGAIARPFSPGGAARGGKSMVLVLDCSASMTTADCAGRTRFEAAREAARELIRGLPDDSVAAVVAFSSSARILTGFTDSRTDLEAAIAQAQSGGGGTDLSGALQVADGLAAAAGRDACRVVVLSDAALPANRPVKPVPAAVEFRKFGSAGSNLAVTALEARRSPGGASQVFARVGNFGPERAGLKVRLFLGAGREAPADVRDVVLEPGARTKVNFEVRAPAGMVPVRVEVSPADGSRDAMSIDDTAWAVLPPEREVRILAYTNDGNFLVKALAGLPGTAVVQKSPAEVPKKPGSGDSDWKDADLVVFDACAPKSLPPAGGYLFINSCPPLKAASFGPEVKLPKTVDWDRTHPLTRFAPLDDLTIGSARPVKVGPNQAALLESESGPLVAAWRHEGLRVLVVGFDIYESDWPLRTSFPIFMANAVRWLAEAGPSSALWSAASQRCGQPLVLRAAGFAESAAAAATVTVRLERPDGRAEDLTVGADAPRMYSATESPGLYRAAAAGRRESLFACSVLDEAESDNSARDALNFAVEGARGATVEVSGSGAASGGASAGREYWKWAAALALLVFVVEWMVYNRRLWG